MRDLRVHENGGRIEGDDAGVFVAVHGFEAAGAAVELLHAFVESRFVREKSGDVGGELVGAAVVAAQVQHQARDAFADHGVQGFGDRVAQRCRIALGSRQVDQDVDGEIAHAGFEDAPGDGAVGAGDRGAFHEVGHVDVGHRVRGGGEGDGANVPIAGVAVAYGRFAAGGAAGQRHKAGELQPLGGRGVAEPVRVGLFKRAGGGQAVPFDYFRAGRDGRFRFHGGGDDGSVFRLRQAQAEAAAEKAIAEFGVGDLGGQVAVGNFREVIAHRKAVGVRVAGRLRGGDAGGVRVAQRAPVDALPLGERVFRREFFVSGREGIGPGKRREVSRLGVGVGPGRRHEQ